MGFFFERQPKVKRSSCPRRRQCNSEAVVPLKHQHQRPLFPPPGPPLVLSTTMQLPLLTFIWLVKVCPEKKSLNLNVSRWMCVILRVAGVLRQQGHRTEKRSPPPAPRMSTPKSRLSQRELLTGSQQAQTGTSSELCAERAVELFTRSSSRLHGAVRQLGRSGAIRRF